MDERPPSPPFHGFDTDTFIPGRMEIETKGTGDEEHVVKVRRKRSRGRPKLGCGVEYSSNVNSLNILPKGRELDLNHNKSSFNPLAATPSSRPPGTPSAVPPTSPAPSSATTSSGAKPKLLGTGTSTRPKVYLIDSLETSFGFAKLPKSKAVLGVFLHHLQDSDPPTPLSSPPGTQSDRAAGMTTDQLKAVWKRHFGIRVIHGYDTEMKEASEKIISDDKYIKTKILNLWKDWKLLSRTSRRQDRAVKPAFKKKEEDFMNDVLDMPFNITNRNFETVLKSESGIKDWKEDLQHLHNQLLKEQIGTCAGLDIKQKKRDNRKVQEKFAGASNPAVSEMDQIEEVDDDEESEVEDEGDQDFNVKGKRMTAPKKMDVMGPITVTADRLGLSIRARTMIAASVANALGVDIDQTNISRSSALEISQKKRLTVVETIKDMFQCPVRVFLHWDGKLMTEKGNLESNRVAVYISGVEAGGYKKLLGAPETKDGTGLAEAEVVKKVMDEWGVKKEVCGLVFDTTSTNTGAESGACKFLEDWLGTPLLWIACRHHVHELHLKRVVQGVIGQTKDPGVSLFRRLKSSWHSLDIDYDNLFKFDYSSVPEWMVEEGKAVLAWAERELAKNTWPRDDYKELLKLTIICLGGNIPGFQFMIPGPDHHARWMSKVIYFLKMLLLLYQFLMSEEEKRQVVEISKYILIFYVKHWFQSPLPTCAARNDLTFMANILKYRLQVSPKITFSVMQSCYRHLWYLVPQTVVLALADPGLADVEKEGMARKLHSLERKKIVSGKPEFPQIIFRGEDITLPEMSSLVSSDSWLLFDILGLTGSQDWLTIPANLWTNFVEFKRLREFSENISVCNDVAERGVALITSYINKSESEEQRQALLQVVEFHRNLVINTNKASLKHC